jgi:hypothetical protein
VHRGRERPRCLERETGRMPMREDCRHFESRIYDTGEAARYCLLGLAPEQPWRCPEGCAHYERSVIDGSFETADLARPPVEEEPDADPDNIEGVLADAEAIVEHEAPAALHEIEEQEAKAAPRHWWSRRTRRSDDDGPAGLSNR